MTDLNINDCINERREKSESHTKPSEAFRRYFGPDHGVLNCRYRNVMVTGPSNFRNSYKKQ